MSTTSTYPPSAAFITVTQRHYPTVRTLFSSYAGVRLPESVSLTGTQTIDIEPGSPLLRFQPLLTDSLVLQLVSSSATYCSSRASE